MRKTTIALAMTIGIFGVVAPAHAGSPRSGQLACFDGASEGSGNGICTDNGDGSYTLLIHEDANGTDYAGVYLLNKSLTGKRFADIANLGFSYSGDTAGGSPRFSLPIVGADGRDGWVFVDAPSCNDGAGNVAPLTDASCVVSGYLWNADNTVQQFSYTSWADFLAGETDATVGHRSSFVIFDWAPGGEASNAEGSVTVSDIALGKTTQKQR
jgi:hypothetical protein